jgi:hypothetical protein
MTGFGWMDDLSSQLALAYADTAFIGSSFSFALDTAPHRLAIGPPMFPGDSVIRLLVPLLLFAWIVCK